MKQKEYDQWKQKEYDQWNDPQEFYSDDYFLSKKGVAILHEYLVECILYIGAIK